MALYITKELHIAFFMLKIYKNICSLILVSLSHVKTIHSTFHQFPVCSVHRNIYIALYCVPSL